MIFIVIPTTALAWDFGGNSKVHAHFDAPQLDFDQPAVYQVVALRYCHINTCIYVKIILHDQYDFDAHLGWLVHINQQVVDAYRLIFNAKYLHTTWYIDINIEIEAVLEAWILSIPLCVYTLAEKASNCVNTGEYFR